ncbi:hypothetical protein HBH56_116150 [Parastagonospora nodorum]|nr:hypothetical protein HBH56_116150 [Parastagonospora nodorum]KAH3965838.1 hypothetical protein HBH51_148460 [Parastagonospora nodorum]KAH3973758.1 hypothetical protein HBH52_138490 [Parastagonospora nodorum]KAH4088793.1 hypothetical protein HBH48_119050 [Parastagonospora nodorum]KAH4104207.1 hypothetical protein HBH46_099660 [Parastagonospora nodorum]
MHFKHTKKRHAMMHPKLWADVNFHQNNDDLLFTLNPLFGSQALRGIINNPACLISDSTTVSLLPQPSYSTSFFPSSAASSCASPVIALHNLASSLADTG